MLLPFDHICCFLSSLGVDARDHASFEEALKAQGGLGVAKASSTLAQMKCEGGQGAPTRVDIQSRISNLRAGMSEVDKAAAARLRPRGPG